MFSARLMSVLIAPSLLSADFSRLGGEVRALERAGAGWIHIDVMDGHFAPDLTMGPLTVRALRPLSGLPFDVHLMTSHPEKWIEPFAQAGASHLTAHIEALPRPGPALKKIRRLGLKAGLSLKPDTPAESLFPFMGSLDLVLVMTVEPGRGGQKFLSAQTPKIQSLKKQAMREKRPPLIAVDGGVTPLTAKQAAGADVLISGSYILQSGDYPRAISSLKAAARAGGRS